MRFLRQLTEGRSQAITEGEAADRIKKHCKKAATAYIKGSLIYRGVTIPGTGWAYVDPRKGEPRRSAYAGSNYYTLLLDNLRSWKGYPKRSQSLICTTELSKANYYGSTIWTVFPYDNAVIGVCSASDIFHSFDFVHKYGMNNMQQFNHTLEDIIATYNSGTGWDNDWDTLKKALRRVDAGIDEDWFDEIKDSVGRAGEMLEANWDGTTMGTLNKLMSPKSNHFELKKVGSSLPSGREVWIGSECILVYHQEAFDLVKSLGF